MHKPSHLSVAEAPHHAKKRANRKRRNWNRPLRRFAALLFLAEVAVLLFANPYLHVSKVQINGLQTLSSDQVFAEARIPARANIFLMALREPFGKRLTANPVIAQASRAIRLPDTLVLTVRERRPFATLALGDSFWLLDPKGIPFRALDAPAPSLPILRLPPNLVSEDVALGKPLPGPYLHDAYMLLALLATTDNLRSTKITVDQNANLCLNRRDSLLIKLGQPDDLPQKVALAQATVAAQGGALARNAEYIDVSCPQQPVWMPRKVGGRESKSRESKNGDPSRFASPGSDTLE